MSRASPVHQLDADRRRSAAAIEKPYTCSRCRRSFRRAEHLNRHIRTHTKEKPFACHCGLSFTRQDLLRRHERINHTSEDVIEPDVPHEDSAMQATNWSEQSHNVDTSAVEDHALINDPTGESFQLSTLPGDSSMNTLLEFDNGDMDMFAYDDHINSTAWTMNDQDSNQLPEDSHFLSEQQQQNRQESLHDETYGSIPYGSWIPFIPPTPTNPEDEEQPPPTKAATAPFRMTESQRSQLDLSLQNFRQVIPTFKLPSHHTLSRYLTSFFETFHSYMPFVHIPTLRLEDCVPEFVLAMATVGAQSRLEHRNADTLFYAAKSVVMQRMREQDRQWSGNVRHSERSSSFGSQQSPMGNGLPATEEMSDTMKKAQLQTIRCIFLLLGYASWERPEILREAFGIRSILVRYLRRVGLREDATNSAPTWHEWAQDECDRRIKFVAFCFLNMHSVAFDTPPVLLSSEVRLRLPCSTKEWDAPSAAAWQSVRSGLPQLEYRTALSLLLDTSDNSPPLSPTPCPLGKYILMHGVLQRIFLVRELSSSIDDQRMALPEHEMDKIESALRTWISLWRINLESSLSTPNGNGPISITSNALLGLAHVRLHLNLGPYRLLEARDPLRTADALYSAPYPERTERLIPALVYSAHALSIPVRLGIDFVAGSQAFRWSVRHALTGLESAVLLSKWLFALQDPRVGQAPSGSETKVFQWITRIVEEAWDSMDRDDETEDALQLEPSRIGIAVVEIWARILQGNIQWPIIKFLGMSLDRYAMNLREGA